VAARLLPGNPYDGHTLAETLATVQSITGVAVTDAYVDKGYRGHGVTGSTRVHVAGQRGSPSRAERKRRRRRSAIEPKIGHLKSDHRMDRCFLKGLTGDAINAVLAAAGSNLRKLLRRLAAALSRWLELLLAAHSVQLRSVAAKANDFDSNFKI
jgi:IS5 family transposase